MSTHVFRGSVSAGPRERVRRRRDGARAGTGVGSRARRNRLAPGPLDLGGAEELLRGPVLPAELCRPAHVLTLPRLGPQVAPRLDIFADWQGTVTIGEALYAEGILDPQCWTGNLAQSVQQGLFEWANFRLGMDQTQHLGLSLIYTDDSRNVNSELTGEEWILGNRGVPDEPVGMFAICAESYGEAFVGHRLKVLNRFYRGVGYHLMSVINRALWSTIRGATPCWALEDIEERWGWMAQEELEEYGYLSPPEFHKEVPLLACRWALPNGIRRALKNARIRLSNEPLSIQVADLSEALEVGLCLLDRLPEKPKYSDETSLFNNDVEQVLPLSVRWSRKDAINRVSDDWHECVANSGFQTDILWSVGFQVSRPETVRAAAAQLKGLMEIVGDVNRLLCLLHCDQAEEECRIRVRVNGSAGVVGSRSDVRTRVENRPLIEVLV